MYVVILYGGVEQYILNVADYIDKGQFDIEILLPNREYERETELLERGIKVIKYDCHSMREQVSEFYQILKNGKYDVVHFHTGHESALLCLVAKFAGNKKLIVHSHTTMSGDENKKIIHRLKKTIVFKLSEIIYKKIAIRVACSEDAAEFMFGKDNGQVLILKNGIDLKRFVDIKQENSEFSFVINARFDPQKNPYFVVDIIYEMVKKEPRVKLEWIGSGHMENEIKKYIRELKLEDYIKLLGTTKEVEYVLARNKYFLFPSVYEGLGIVLIEAQASGLKCFISENLPRLVDCGGCVRISLEKSAREWASLILDEIEKNPKVNTIKEKLEEFDIRQSVKVLENLYG